MGITLHQLLQNTFNLVYLLLQMAIIWPWSVIIYFLPKNKKDITGEILFMTGAGSGIGRAMCIKFAELGAIVICTDPKLYKAEETANKIKSNGGQAHSFQLDVTDRMKVYELAEKIRETIGDVSLLVNNAGIVTGKKILESSDELMIKTMEVNAIAHFWTLKAFLPSMLEKNHGHIIAITSAAGHIGIPTLVDYCASKYAAVGIHESLSVELHGNKDNQIVTSCVCPIFIKTGMFEGVTSGSPHLLPLMEVDYTVNSIVSGILNNEKNIFVPRILMILITLKHIVPSALIKPISDYLKLHDQMVGFVGRDRKTTTK